MLTQRVTRFHKRKIIGGSFLKNVFDKVTNLISTGSKIINRIPTGVRSNIAKLAKPLLTKAIDKITAPKALTTTTKVLPKQTTRQRREKLNDMSRAILSNLIAGSGFKNYIS